MSSSDATPLRRGSELALTEAEIASTTVVGEHPGVPDLPMAEAAPRRALEEALAAHLENAPCFVSFSGGRDSSAVLAVATHVARKEGLPPPVPATLVFPKIAEAAEEQWQRDVLAHLDVKQWERVTIDDELDFVGPAAASALERHGLLWPVNGHAHVPLLRLAAGGVLLTGVDGDGLMQGWHWTRAASLRGKRPRSVSEALAKAHPFAPRALRFMREMRGVRTHSALRPKARRAVVRRVAGERVAEPAQWDRRLTWWHKRRYLWVLERTMGLHAADAGAVIRHPLLDETFLGALARLGGRDGLGHRTAMMDRLFGDLLPGPVIARRDKARFGRAFWGPTSTEFARSWDGTGVNEDLVDVAALRSIWAQDEPDTRTALLLQQAWLRSR